MTDKDYVIAVSTLLDKTEEDLTKDYGEPLCDAAVKNLLDVHRKGILVLHQRVTKLTQSKEITDVIFSGKNADTLVQMAKETFAEMVKHPVGWYYDGNNVIQAIYYHDDHVQSLLAQILTTEKCIGGVMNCEAVNKEELERNGEYIFFLKEIQMKYYTGNNILCDPSISKFLISIYELEQKVENLESEIERIKEDMLHAEDDDI